MGEIEKSPYLSNGVTDRREIWQGHAFWQGLAGYRWALPRISSFMCENMASNPASDTLWY